MISPSTVMTDMIRPRSEAAALTPSTEQVQLRDTIRGLLGKYSDIEQVRAASGSERGFCPRLWRTLVDDMSVTTLAVPENRGGLGYGMVELAIVLEGMRASTRVRAGVLVGRPGRPRRAVVRLARQR